MVYKPNPSTWTLSYHFPSKPQYQIKPIFTVDASYTKDDFQLKMNFELPGTHFPVNASDQKSFNLFIIIMADKNLLLICTVKI